MDISTSINQRMRFRLQQIRTSVIHTSSVIMIIVKIIVLYVSGLRARLKRFKYLKLFRTSYRAHPDYVQLINRHIISSTQGNTIHAVRH